VVAKNITHAANGLTNVRNAVKYCGSFFSSHKGGEFPKAPTHFRSQLMLISDALAATGSGRATVEKPRTAGQSQTNLHWAVDRKTRMGEKQKSKGKGEKGAERGLISGTY